MQPGILIRVNELALKSDRKQNFFLSAFINSLQDAFTKHGFSDFTCEQFGHSLFISHDAPKDLIPTLLCVPGVELFTIATSFSFDSYENLLEKSFTLSQDVVADKKFRVTARRFGNHDFTSMNVAADLGEKLMDFSAGVDLHNPEVTVFVETRNSTCFVYTDWQKGIGGMPAGSAGKALVLFSGGIDCPVAMYQALRKGCFIDSLFVNLVGETVRNDVFSVYNYLIDKFSFTHKPKMFEVDAKSLPAYLEQHVPNTLRQQALKIVFYKLGKALLKKSGAWGLVTGESLSQKSTQTIQSLDLIQNFASPLLVLRPLIMYDKAEIITLARTIGTFAASEVVKEQCNISAGKVTAVPHPKDFEKIPDLDPLVNDLLEKITVHTGIIPINNASSKKITSLPSNSFVIDIRTGSMRKKKPITCDQSSVYPDILSSLHIYNEKNKTYVFVCPFGVLGKEVAHVVSKKGFKAIGLSVGEYLSLIT